MEQNFDRAQAVQLSNNVERVAIDTVRNTAFCTLTYFGL